MNLTEKRGPALVLHWGKGPILTHIESALCDLGYDSFALTRCAERIPAIVRSIAQRKPVLCITRQRLYGNMDEVARALSQPADAARCSSISVSGRTTAAT